MIVPSYLPARYSHIFPAPSLSAGLSVSIELTYSFMDSFAVRNFSRSESILSYSALSVSISLLESFSPYILPRAASSLSVFLAFSSSCSSSCIFPAHTCDAASACAWLLRYSSFLILSCVSSFERDS